MTQPSVESGLHYYGREQLLEIIKNTPEERLGLLTIASRDASLTQILVKIEGATLTLTAVRS